MNKELSVAQSLFEQKKYEDSIAASLKVLSCDSQSIKALTIISKCMLSISRIDDARLYLAKLLAIEPENYEAITILGQAYQAVGDMSTAKEYYRKAMSINGEYLQALIALGCIESDFGSKDEAISLLKKAIGLAPKVSLIWHRLANNYLERSDSKEAEVCMLRAIELSPNIAEYHNELGRILHLKGDISAAINSYKLALSINPDFVNAKILLNNACSTIIPAWHIPMMNDLKRNNAYKNAINKAVEESQVVLEIGTGSGLLSMMAVDAGARKVITCEVNETIAQVAEKIIFQNGFSERITVIHKKSTDLVVGVDLTKKVDLVISEILSSEFVGEGVIPTMLDVNRRLLNKNGKMIPESGDIRVALLRNSVKAREDNLVGDMYGYDLSEYNKITQTKTSNILKENPSLISSIEVAFSFNFYTAATLIEQEKVLEIEVLESCTCLGLITWLRLNLYDDISFENKPSELGSGWINPIYLFEKPLPVSAGQRIKVKATLKRDFVWFEFIELV